MAFSSIWYMTFIKNSALSRCMIEHTPNSIQSPPPHCRSVPPLAGCSSCCDTQHHHRKVLPGRTTLLACWSLPARDWSSWRPQDFLDNHFPTSTFNSSSLSSGSRQPFLLYQFRYLETPASSLGPLASQLPLGHLTP